MAVDLVLHPAVLFVSLRRAGDKLMITMRVFCVCVGMTALWFKGEYTLFLSTTRPNVSRSDPSPPLDRCRAAKSI